LVFPANQANGAGRLSPLQELGRQAPNLTMTEPAGSPSPQRGTETAPLHGATPTDALRRQASPCRSLRESAAPAKGRSTDRSQASGKARGKSASESAQRHRALRSVAGQSASSKIPLTCSSPPGRLASLAPCDRHRQAETPQAARWSKPAQTGLRNRARCGLARRRRYPRILAVDRALLLGKNES
jgi:hypothetical protein